jgi:glycosyltransferase involved in cell wall biosynthesis
MSLNPKAITLSIIMPVFNERHLVGFCLRRLLALNSQLISSLEVIAVDDHSTDGTDFILEQVAREDSRVKLIRHESHQGKGSAIQTALKNAQGDICLIHDADLEYSPNDIPQILLPFFEEGADAVFGSRYMPAQYRRVLMFWDTQLNKFITGLTNLFSDLNLSDVQTCYKAVKTPLLKSIPIRSKDFQFEVELTMKLAKRHARIFEVPIRYMPRTAQEGKKRRARDGLLALLATLRYWLIDDIYHHDQYGSLILNDLQNARNFNQWMGDTLRPFIGDRVIELGAGIGNLTNQFIPRDLYFASDIEETYLNYLKSFAQGKPYLHVDRIDANAPEDFAHHKNKYDTVVMINLLEHVPDEYRTLQNISEVLTPGGKAVILVPQHPKLYGSLDEVLGHRERYTSQKLVKSLEENGFYIEQMCDFNRISVPAWYINAKILKKTKFSAFQLKVLEILLPVIKIIDRWLPWSGVSLIAVARKG